MRDWLENSWPALTVIAICVVLFWIAHVMVAQEKAEEKVKFDKCMNDIHNVYVCETWARGKDVEVYFIPQSGSL